MSTEIERGDFVMVCIVDEMPEGDGTVMMEDWDEVTNVNSLGNIELLNSGLIAIPSEVIAIIRQEKIKTKQ